MKIALKTLGSLCSTSLLFGCTSLPQDTRLTVAPALKVRHSYETADAYYSLGRYHHGSRRFTDAINAYQRALEISAGDTRARSALGVLFAEKGDYPNAIAMLMQAADAEPNDSHHFSNLGYAYMLHGDYAQAERALEKATSLDPRNMRAWNNLASLMTKLQRKEQARLIYTRIEQLQDSPSKGAVMAASDTATSPQPHAAASGKPIPPPFAQDVPFQVSTPAQDSKAHIREVAPSIYEIRHVAATAAPAASASASAPARHVAVQPVSQRADAHGANRIGDGKHCMRSSPLWQEVRPDESLPPAPMAVRFEISNGNGITGMAQSLGRLLCGQDLAIVRLTNQKAFNIPTTRIEYSAGHENTARTLAKYLHHATVLEVKSLHHATDIRVVLGTDMMNIESLVARFPFPMNMTGTQAAPKS